MKSTHRFNQARAAGDAFLGVEVSWDLGEYARDVTIPREQFEQLFLDAGAPPEMFTPKPTPENSLPRACRIGWSIALKIDPKIIKVTQLSRTENDSSLAFAVLYRISVEGEKDRWETGARVRIEQGIAQVRPPAEMQHFPSRDAERWAQACADYANERSYTAFNADVSDALVQFGNYLGWVSRRQSGGVYFLPGTLGEAFMQVLDGLERLAERDDRQYFEGNSTPQYADPRTLQTWKRRTVGTFEDEIKRLTTKLKDMTSRDNVRVSSFDNRTTECALLVTRAQQYASVLQDQLDPLREQLELLKSQFGDAQQKLSEAKSRGDDAFSSINKMTEAQTRKQQQQKKAPRPEPRLKRRLPSKEVLDGLFEVG